MFSADFDMDQNDVVASKLYNLLDEGVDSGYRIYNELHRLIKSIGKPYGTYDIPRGAKFGTILTLESINGVTVLKILTVTQPNAYGSQIILVSNSDTNRTMGELNLNNIAKITGHRACNRFDEVCYYIEGKELFKKLVDRMSRHAGVRVKGRLDSI